jgi:LuxR family maltose regulon positive regulatory protein
MVGQPFVLKTTPPRTHRLAVARPRLDQFWSDNNERTATLVEAPRGFGKTTLLTQWRRRSLERGSLVAWVALDAEDDPLRFGQTLLYAMRVASGRASFEALSAQFRARSEADFDALTGLLTEIANLATPTVIMFDDAERLPAATVEQSLAYLLLNAPPNLRLVIGSRAPVALPTAEMQAHNDLTRLTAKDLRFELDESVAVLRERFGARLTLDDCVKLHEMTEGWPIGLQLAAAAIERENDPARAIEALSARQGDIERYFVESLFERLPASQREFLTRIAILDTITPELAEHVTGCAAAATYLDQLMADTPMLAVAEHRDWIRLHLLARDFLMGRFEALPPAEQRDLHLRAAEWFASESLLHDAGRHALAAGEHQRARAWADRAIWHLASRGRLAEARQWLEHVTPSDMEHDLPLRLAATWFMALGERPAEAMELIGPVLNDPSQNAPARFEAALIYTCAAGFCDRVGLIETAIAPWRSGRPELGEPVYAVAYANTLALLALVHGETDELRQVLSEQLAKADEEDIGYSRAIGRAFIGYSHLWDGNAIKAVAAASGALQEAERATGRRGAPSTLLATMLAAAALELGQADEAQALLANRLDVIEHSGVPDAIIEAHRTLAGIAWGRGDEARALDVLENLRVLGVARGIPRMVMTSLAEQVRIHALAARPETARERLTQLETMRSAFRRADFLPFLAIYDLRVATARAYAALAAGNNTAADAALKRANTLAVRLGRGRDVIAIKALRAVNAAAKGEARRAGALLQEAAGLAAIGGLTRVLADAHPRAAALLAGLVDTTATASAPGAGQPAMSVAALPAATTARSSASSGMLTPKEAEILRLLDANRSNKEIARSMEVSDETVKWHLKNLYSKLDAGTRRHAVDRARLLGLIGT